MKNNAILMYVKINTDIFATLYYNQKAKDTLIYCKGAPTYWDHGTSDFIKIAEEFCVNILVPDYLGYARSNGSFSLQNCAKTIWQCISAIKQIDGTLINLKDHKSVELTNQNIILIGSSFGGGIALTLPIFYPNVKNLISNMGFLAPMTDWSTQSNDPGIPEESLIDFDYIVGDVLPNIYRGYLGSDMQKLIRKDKNSLKLYNPINNIKAMKGFNIYITHGSKDTSIHWKKSKRYVEKLMKENIQVEFKLLPNVAHGGNLKCFGLSWILKSIQEK